MQNWNHCSPYCMQKDSSQFTHLWATGLVQQLHRMGVADICIAPGSRNAPLVIAAARIAGSHSDLKLHTHLDERALGYYALGLIKALERPVVVICTSGTAVANLHPAVIEAFQCSLPLIVLSADRPEELLNCGANQAINQKEIFSQNIVGYCQFEPVTDTGEITQNLQQVTGLVSDLQGPVQLNCAFREPLYPADEQDSVCPQTLLVEQITSGTSPQIDTLELAPSARTLLVAGDLTISESDAVMALAERYQLPILADINSNLPQHPLVIQGVELLLSNGPEALQPYQQVLQFGGHLVGKRLLRWLAETDFENYQLVSPYAHKLDPSRTAEQIQMEVAAYCAGVYLPVIDHQALFTVYSNVKQQAEQFIDQTAFGELQAVKAIAESCGQGIDLFIGNSLSIRLADLQTCRKSPVFTNRGASGIDGLLATACGLHRARGKPTLLLLGDTSLLHDLNSLLLARNSQSELPLVIVVLNNDGGSIFNLLPAAQFGDIHNDYFQMPHGLKFENAAPMFGLNYQAPMNKQAFGECLEQALNSAVVTLIELIVPSDQSADQIRALYQHLALVVEDNPEGNRAD